MEISNHQLVDLKSARFEAEMSICGQYRLILTNGTRNSILLYEDPACGDLSDKDIAMFFFEDWIDENFDARALNIIDKAFAEGYDITTSPKDPKRLVVDCERYLTTCNEDE